MTVLYIFYIIFRLICNTTETSHLKNKYFTMHGSKKRKVE